MSMLAVAGRLAGCTSGAGSYLPVGAGRAPARPPRPPPFPRLPPPLSRWRSLWLRRAYPPSRAASPRMLKGRRRGVRGLRHGKPPGAPWPQTRRAPACRAQEGRSHPTLPFWQRAWQKGVVKGPFGREERDGREWPLEPCRRTVSPATAARPALLGAPLAARSARRTASGRPWLPWGSVHSRRRGAGTCAGGDAAAAGAGGRDQYEAISLATRHEEAAKAPPSCRRSRAGAGGGGHLRVIECDSPHCSVRSPWRVPGAAPGERRWRRRRAR